MQKHVNLKHVTLLLGLLLTAVWCGAREIGLKDGFSNINIKEGNVQGVENIGVLVNQPNAINQANHAVGKKKSITFAYYSYPQHVN